GSAAAVHEELSLAEPDPSILGSHAEDIAKCCNSLLERWRHLEEYSPYRDGALHTAIETLEAILEAAQRAGSTVETAIALEGELADLVVIAAKWQIGATLRKARGTESQRGIARRVVMSAGYLSELEAGQAGLPSESVCKKLDGALNTDVQTMVSRARDRE